MKQHLSPSAILEQLADKVISQIERLAVTGFDEALREMNDFHAFLMEGYFTVRENEANESFANLGDVRAAHEDWLAQYHRVLERAVVKIDEEDDFVISVCHSITRLLPADGQRSDTQVSTSALDLMRVLVHRLESWVSKRLIRTETGVKDTKQEPHLPGSEKTTYDNVMRRLVGAWEQLPIYIPAIYQYKIEELDPHHRWARMSSAWPVLFRHLQNSAYMLIVSVWNEDTIGSDYYCDSLLRWPTSVDHEISHLSRHPTISAYLLSKDWAGAEKTVNKRFEKIANPNWTPIGVFKQIIKSTHQDCIAIASGVLLRWSTTQLHSAAVAGHITYRLLISGRVTDGSAHRTTRGEFRNFLVCLIRLAVSGDDFYRESWRRLIRESDSIAERNVVPGRMYMSSVASDFDALTIPWLSCQIALIPEEGKELAVTEFITLLENMEAFFEAGSIFEKALQLGRRMISSLDIAHRPSIKLGLLSMQNDAAGFDDKVSKLASFWNNFVTTVAANRAARIRAAQISKKKLVEISHASESGLRKLTPLIPEFSGIKVRVIEEKLAVRKFVIPVEKGQLIDPPLIRSASDIVDSLASAVAIQMAAAVWGEFSQLPIREIILNDPAEWLAAITEALSIAGFKGKSNLVLVTYGTNDPEWDDTNLPSPSARSTAGHARNFLGNWGQIVTYSAHDFVIQNANLRPGESLLFRSDMLEAIEYGSHPDGRIVAAKFEAGDQVHADALILEWFPKLLWHVLPIIKFKFI